MADTLEREWMHTRPRGPGDSACAGSADWACLNVRCNIPNCKGVLKKILSEFVTKQQERSSGCCRFFLIQRGMICGMTLGSAVIETGFEDVVLSFVGAYPVNRPCLCN